MNGGEGRRRIPKTPLNAHSGAASNGSINVDLAAEPTFVGPSH